MKSYLYIVAAVILMLSFDSCRKSKMKDIQPSKDFALVMQNINSVVHLVNSLANNETHLKQIIEQGADSANTCAQIAMVSGDTNNVSSSSPLTFSISYSGCVDNNHLHKSGTINCKLNAYLGNSGGYCLCSFNNLLISGNELSGTITITKTGNHSYFITTQNLSLTTAKSSVYFDGTIQMTQIRGENTFNNVQDDRYSISLSAVVTDRYKTVVEVFAEELMKEYDCRWTSWGYAELIEDDKKVQVLDFGNGACNNEATVSVEEKVYDIDLP